MRRLREAADEGDAATVDERLKELVRWLDRAAARGALHKNTAARRKAQAARLVAEKR
jgi:small subunit ribosomal protein S20